MPPFFQEAVRTKKIAEAVFAFYLAKDASAPKGGELTLGGVDPTFYSGEFTYTPVTTPGYWQFSASAVAVGGKAFSGEIKAIADTGTNACRCRSPAGVFRPPLERRTGAARCGQGAVDMEQPL